MDYVHMKEMKARQVRAARAAEQERVLFGDRFATKRNHRGNGWLLRALRHGPHRHRAHRGMFHGSPHPS